MINQKQLWRLLQASKALIQKMNKITNSEEWQGLLKAAKMVGFDFEGEDWADEYKTLEYEIETLERENAQNI